MRKDRYERAVEWMKAVAAEEISIEGAPLLPAEERAGNSNFRITSNRKGQTTGNHIRLWQRNKNGITGASSPSEAI